MTDRALPFRRRTAELVTRVTVQAGAARPQAIARPTRRQETVIAVVVLTNGLRTRTYRLSYVGHEPVFTGAVVVDGTRRRYDRVVGPDAGERLRREYETEIAGLQAAGWNIT